MSGFKEGDKVICINALGRESCGLKLTTYTVGRSEIHDGKDFVSLVGFEGSSFRVDRFRLATPKTTQARPDCLEYLKAELREYVTDPAGEDDKYEQGYQAALETVMLEVYGIVPVLGLTFASAAA